MSVYAQAFYFNDKKSLKQFARDCKSGFIKFEERREALGVVGFLHQTFGYQMKKMLINADYNIPDPDGLQVILRERDLDDLVPFDRYCEDDLKFLREGFKEFNAKFVYLA